MQFFAHERFAVSRDRDRDRDRDVIDFHNLVQAFAKGSIEDALRRTILHAFRVFGELVVNGIAY